MLLIEVVSLSIDYSHDCDSCGVAGRIYYVIISKLSYVSERSDNDPRASEYTPVYLQWAVRRYMGFCEQSDTLRFEDCIVMQVFAVKYDKWFVFMFYVYICCLFSKSITYFS